MLTKAGRVAGLFMATALGAAALGGAPLLAQDRDTTVARLQAQVDAITRELESLRLGHDVVVADTSLQGFGPAASKIYKAGQGVSLGGYGEFLYENFAGKNEGHLPVGQESRIDAVRAIAYLGYRFNDKLLFNSEIEFEHGSTESGGAVSVEFGYLEYRVSPRFGVRAGMLLSPMGFLNEIHEPPTFLGTHRPETEQLIIPSTWHENGLGVFGASRNFDYRAYVINGFDASGFSGSEGLREGRQGGAEAAAHDFGGVARVDYTGVRGLVVGTAGYLGNSGQNAALPSNPSDTLRARTMIWDGHAQYKARGFDVRALVAVATVDDAAGVNDVAGLTGTESVGKQMVGWYVQGGYDLLRGRRTEQQLVPYVRFEKLNTQNEVPAGFSPDPANDRRIWTVGAMWKLLPNVAVKADYQFVHNQAKTGVNQLSLNLGYLF